MTLEVSLELTGFVVLAVGQIASLSYSNGRRDGIEKNVGENLRKLASEISDVWRWREAHEREANHKREEFDAKITELKVINATTTAQYENLLKRLDKIEELIKSQGRN